MINLRELWAIQLGLLHFSHSGGLDSRGIFGQYTTALAYIRKQGGTLSPALNREARLLLRWAKLLGITIVPQFIMGTRNVVADALELPGPGYQVRVDLSSGGGRRVGEEMARDGRSVRQFPQLLSSVYFSPLNDPMAAGTDAFLQSWDRLQAYALSSVRPHMQYPQQALVFQG